MGVFVHCYFCKILGQLLVFLNSNFVAVNCDHNINSWNKIVFGRNNVHTWGVWGLFKGIKYYLIYIINIYYLLFNIGILNKIFILSIDPFYLFGKLAFFYKWHSIILILSSTDCVSAKPLEVFDLSTHNSASRTVPLDHASPHQGPILWFFKLFHRKIRRKNGFFDLKQN
jgi:hypothetical protein